MHNRVRYHIWSSQRVNLPKVAHVVSSRVGFYSDSLAEDNKLPLLLWPFSLQKTWAVLCPSLFVTLLGTVAKASLIIMVLCQHTGPKLLSFCLAFSFLCGLQNLLVPFRLDWFPSGYSGFLLNFTLWLSENTTVFQCCWIQFLVCCWQSPVLCLPLTHFIENRHCIY